MLRRTANRAFGSGDAPRPPLPPEPEAVQPGRALDRFFGELHSALEAEAAAGAPGDAAGGLRLSRPRSLSRGIEFVLEGRGGALRFVHRLSGPIEVHRGAPAAGAAGPPCEVIALQARGAVYRPVRKILPAGMPWPPAPLERRRSGFSFTSVPELARTYALALRGARAEPPGGPGTTPMSETRGATGTTRTSSKVDSPRASP